MDQFGSGLGQKSNKGAVSITNCEGRIRLRWRYQGKRYSLSLSIYNKLNLLQAGKTALQIVLTIYRFGSKPSFYSSFKKIKGCTPKEYLRQNKLQ